MSVIDSASRVPIKWVPAREYFSTLHTTSVSIPPQSLPRKTVIQLTAGQGLRLGDPGSKHFIIRLSPAVYLELYPGLYSVTNDPNSLPKDEGEVLPYGTAVTITF